MFIQKEHDINSHNSKEKNSEKQWLVQLHLTKIKYNKSLQSQRTKSETKTSFNFTVFFCIYVSKMEFNNPSTLSIRTSHGRVTKNYSL